MDLDLQGEIGPELDTWGVSTYRYMLIQALRAALGEWDAQK